MATKRRKRRHSDLSVEGRKWICQTKTKRMEKRVPLALIKQAKLVRSQVTRGRKP